MSDHVTPINQSITLLIVTMLAFGLRPSLSLCETRCEQSIPALYKLRAYWSRSFKRFGENRVSFEQFLLSLVQKSQSDDEAVRLLRTSLLRIIGRFQDCVMACEHQFSKRSKGFQHSRMVNNSFFSKSIRPTRTPGVQSSAARCQQETS